MARVKQWDHPVLPATHARTIPAFTLPPQGVTAVWLVLIRLPAKRWIYYDKAQHLNLASV